MLLGRAKCGFDIVHQKAQVILDLLVFILDSFGVTRLQDMPDMEKDILFNL
jgi:hypothetical protein